MSVNGLAVTVRDGDRRASLEALRDLLGLACEAATPQQLAPLARQLQSVLAELDELIDPNREGSVVDELSRRRSSRGATTSDPVDAAEPGR